ncbi:F-box domain protein [Favolaschia claudopus]|uniref:F-box domain protein n=1 Tax=Favolaschia claudopus TaxID=2862362 RepID=A0AAW0CPQ7_9AGAR
MSTSQDTVISSPELLELVLSHLPMRDLLCIAPLVSKAWQATTTTPLLQRILFFEPDPSADPRNLIQNPLLAEIFSPFFTRLENPHAYHWPGRTASIWEMPWLKKLDAFRRAGASWRRMLVTQPPVRTLALKHVTSYQLGSTTRQATLSDLSLRMGFLFDLILPLTQDGVWFWIDWHGAGDEHGHTFDSTIHLRKSIGCMVDTRPVKRDTRFDSEEMKIVEIPFDPPLQKPVVWDDDDEKEFLMDIEKELELKRKRKEGVN